MSKKNIRWQSIKGSVSSQHSICRSCNSSAPTWDSPVLCNPCRICRARRCTRTKTKNTSIIGVEVPKRCSKKSCLCLCPICLHQTCTPCSPVLRVPEDWLFHWKRCSVKEQSKQLPSVEHMGTAVKCEVYAGNILNRLAELVNSKESWFSQKKNYISFYFLFSFFISFLIIFLFFFLFWSLSFLDISLYLFRDEKWKCQKQKTVLIINCGVDRISGDQERWYRWQCKIEAV